MSTSNPAHISYRGLPLYEAVIDGEQDGIFCVSFVSCPATETAWLLFSDAQKRPLLFNNEKMEVTGVLMLAETPIYRVDTETGSGYYLYYSVSTLQQMVSKLLKDNAFNNIDTQHDGITLPVGSCEMTEIYAKAPGKCPPEFAGIPDGSLICSYKIHDTELWGRMKSGEFTGYSLAGWFTLVAPEQNEIINLKDNIMKKKNVAASKQSRKNSIKALLSRLLLNFEETVLSDGTVWIHDGELAEGVAVTLEDGTPVPDGDYETDTFVVTVTGGAVSAVTPKEEEVEAEETGSNGGEDDLLRNEIGALRNEIDTLRNEIGALRSDLDSLKSELDEIKAALAAKEDTPVVEMYSKANVRAAEGKMSKTARFIAAL